MATKESIFDSVIEPNKCIIEDIEILGFENEEQLNYYTVWHEALFDKRRESNAQTERERQIIRDEIARKTSKLIEHVKHRESPSTRTSPQKRAPPATPPLVTRPNRASAPIPNGLTIINTTLPCGQQLLKYKLTKLYNKYRGRQMRRNFVLEKQMNARIEAEIAKSHLTSWLTYTALQAISLPETQNLLNATTNNHKILTPMAQPTIAPIKKGKTAKKQTTSEPSSPQNSGQKPPLHLVYIDPGNIITYSNKINPQQVAEYRQKSRILPSTATSKKSSAASYDVYEIMNVLANTSKTNVTITRNANRPNASIYSHSVNANTPGIVSTQLHLQARSYLDSMAKFYAQEAERLEQEREELKKGPTDEEMVRKYLNLEVDEQNDCDDELEKLEEDIRLLHQNTRGFNSHNQINETHDYTV